MKKALFLPIMFCLALCIGCKEAPPTIVPCQTDRMVLVEEFTGMACVGCPNGHRKIKELQLEYPNKIIPIAIHSGNFAAPYQGYDFRTTIGNELTSFIGPRGYPSAVINRELFEGEAQLDFIYPTTWAGPIAKELCLPADAALEIQTQYDAANREVVITVDVEGTNTVRMKKNIGLTVLITESHIIAPQKDLSGWVSNYEHNHLLRDYVTGNTWGKQIQEKGEVLSPQQEQFSYTLPNDWVAENCHIIAFVHHQGDERYILQATEVNLVP